MTRALLKWLAGEEALSKMCAKGQTHHKLDGDLAEAVKAFVNERYKTKIDAEFNRVVNLMCGKLRRTRESTNQSKSAKTDKGSDNTDRKRARGVSAKEIISSDESSASTSSKKKYATNKTPPGVVQSDHEKCQTNAHQKMKKTQDTLKDTSTLKASISRGIKRENHELREPVLPELEISGISRRSSKNSVHLNASDDKIKRRASTPMIDQNSPSKYIVRQHSSSSSLSIEDSNPSFVAKGEKKSNGQEARLTLKGMYTSDINFNPPVQCSYSSAPADKENVQYTFEYTSPSSGAAFQQNFTPDGRTHQQYWQQGMSSPFQYQNPQQGYTGYNPYFYGHQDPMFASNSQQHSSMNHQGNNANWGSQEPIYYTYNNL